MNTYHHHQVSGSTVPLKAEMSIGELSRLTGYNAKAIRYYEQIGILPRPTRADNAYRRYSQTDVYRLNLLRRLRLLGISLAEAKLLLVATIDAPCHKVQNELLHLINARLVALDQQIAELHHLREQVAGYQQQLASGIVQKDELFMTCYDQSCLACSPAPLPPQHLFCPEARTEGDNSY
jgi:DNA-binding transcriptional MerR regulator